MSRSGFPVAVKSRGNYFFYIRKSFRNKEGKARNENIFSLGQRDSAIQKLNSWIEFPEQKPDLFKKHQEEDFKRWIDYVNSK